MGRRAVSLLLVLAGGVPLGWALRMLPAEGARGGAVAALALFGIGLNLTAVTRRHLEVRPGLRALGCAVAMITATAALLLWARLRSGVLPALAEGAPGLRSQAALAAGSLLWIGAGLVYVGLSLLLLPPRRPPGPQR